jgi:hypothetical protein
MSKEATDLKYPMVDLLTGVTMSLMYLNVLAASNLLLLSAPWVLMQAWMKDVLPANPNQLNQAGKVAKERAASQRPAPTQVGLARLA